MRRVVKVSVLAVATLMLSAAQLVHAEGLSPAEDKSGSMKHALSAYDYMVSTGSKQVRLKMESVGGDKVYSSFIDGTLIANVRVPEVVSASDATAFNQYVKASSDALTQAGVDPKTVGLSYVSATTGGSGAKGLVSQKAVNAQPSSVHHHMTITSDTAH